MSAAENIVTVAAGTPRYFQKTPFSRDQVARISSAGAANVYGVNYPGIWNPNAGPQAFTAQRTFRIGGDGVTTTFSETKYPFLADLDIVNAAGLNPANTLRVVARVVGVGYKHIKLLVRVGSDATPTAGQFKVQDNGGNTEVVLGDAADVPEGSSLEIWKFDASGESPNGIRTIVAPLTANVPVEEPMMEVISVGTAATTFEAIGKGGGS